MTKLKKVNFHSESNNTSFFCKSEESIINDKYKIQIKSIKFRKKSIIKSFIVSTILFILWLYFPLMRFSEFLNNFLKCNDCYILNWVTFFIFLIMNLFLLGLISFIFLKILESGKESQWIDLDDYEKYRIVKKN